MTPRRAGALAKMSGAAKHKPMKLSVKPDVALSRGRIVSRPVAPHAVCMRDMNGGAQVGIPHGGRHNDEFASLTDMSQFDYDNLGVQALKGIDKPTHAYRIVGVSEVASRFEAASGAELTPLVGRTQELSLLLERWQLTKDGEGQVVLLCGEPGIGKSRILNTLRGRLGKQGAQALRFQCSPYHVNSPFYPVIDHFERALKFNRDESPDARLEKLEALMVEGICRPKEEVRFIASMLSLPGEQRYGEFTMTPQKFKDETLRAFVDLIQATARKQPSLMLYEDVHWADPSSLEALDLLVDRARDFPAVNRAHPPARIR
jgi:hypothetical protein